MSANTSIKEGGKGRAFGPVTALMVQGDDGKYLPWMPESERQLDTLSVSKNGVYQAKKDGVYGWRSVSVNVTTDQGVTGTDPTTGQQVAVGVGPTGELTETVVPVEIRVRVPPTKTEYTHGETIDYSGIVVHAYDATGADMGEVPFNELIFQVTTADVGSSEWTDGDGLNAVLISYTPHYNVTYDYRRGIEITEQVYCCGDALGTHEGRPATYGGANEPGTVLLTRYRGQNYGASMTGPRVADWFWYYAGEDDVNKWYRYTGWYGKGTSTATPGDKEFRPLSWSDELTSIPSSSVDPTTIDPSTLHAAQLLPVQWSRPGDGAVLETSFGINVTSAGGD